MDCCRKLNCVTSEEVETVGWPLHALVLCLLRPLPLECVSIALKIYLFPKNLQFFQYEKYPTKCMKIDDVFRASILWFLQHFPLLWTMVCMNKLNVDVENILRREKQLYISSSHILGLFLEGKNSHQNLASEDFLRILRTSHFSQHFHYSKKSENKIFSSWTSQKRAKAKTFSFLR